MINNLNTTTPHFDVEIDTSGLNCPLPLLRTKRALSKMKAGEILRVIATDIGAFIDIPVYCSISQNILIHTTETEDNLIFIIKKNGHPSSNILDNRKVPAIKQ